MATLAESYVRKEDIYMSSCFVVVVPQDANPFKAERQQLIRLTAEGIAGSKIVADVDGPAKVVAENSVLTAKNGRVLIGVEKVEFVIRPTGCGMASDGSTNPSGTSVGWVRLASVATASIR